MSGTRGAIDRPRARKVAETGDDQGKPEWTGFSRARRSRMNRALAFAAVSALTTLAGGGVANGQAGTGVGGAAGAPQSAPQPTGPRQTLLKMQRLISLDVKD